MDYCTRCTIRLAAKDSTKCNICNDEIAKEQRQWEEFKRPKIYGTYVPPYRPPQELCLRRCSDRFWECIDPRPWLRKCFYC